MDRRDFLTSSAVVGGAFCIGGILGFGAAFLKGKTHPEAGKVWRGWKKGRFQVHFIYTGVSESAFYIFPDGTTMLLDCGDHNAIGRGPLAVPVLPNSKRHAGEWIARYVKRVNPNGADVDYMMLSHYHSDHAGNRAFYASKDVRDGKDYYLSGFSQAAETLSFKKAIDRSWPDFSDPLTMPDDFDSGVVGHMKRFYEYQMKHNGLEVEKFRLGATDQIIPLRGECKNFSVRNICGNGRVCSEDGTVTDLYAGKIAAEHPESLNENGMSLGMIVSYGDFKMYTAGDFSDSWKLPDGSTYKIEDSIADVCPRVNVAKINHHGHYSMTPKLLKVLAPRVFVSCVWDQLHNVAPVMEMCTDRSIYPGERIVCPTIMPAERRAEDAGASWLNDVDPSSFEAGHVVLNVEEGGKEYSISYLTADDESMIVRSVMNFTSEE